MALTAAESTKLLTFDGLTTTSSEAQPSIHTVFILVRSLGNNLRFKQSDNASNLSFESRVKDTGMLMKLLPLRSRCIKEDRPEISRGISPSQRLQSLRFNSLNELKPDSEGNIRAMGFVLLPWITLKREGKFSRNLCDGPLRPLKDRTLKFLN